MARLGWAARTLALWRMREGMRQLNTRGERTPLWTNLTSFMHFDQKLHAFYSDTRKAAGDHIL